VPGRTRSVCAALSSRYSSTRVRPFQSAEGSAGGFTPIGGTAERKQRREFPIKPAGEMPHCGIDPHQRGLRQALALQMRQKRLDHRHEPFRRPGMTVEVVVEAEEALQVAARGIEGGFGLPGDLGHQVERGRVARAVFRVLDTLQAESSAPATARGQPSSTHSAAQAVSK
jgi:hypothetical protein